MFCNYLIAKDFAVHLFIFSNRVVKQQNQKVLISVEPMSSHSSSSVEQDESAASKPRFETKRASISGLASLFGESTKNRFCQ